MIQLIKLFLKHKSSDQELYFILEKLSYELRNLKN